MSRPVVELGDVQGIIRFGYGAMPYARFLLLEISDPGAARTWLAGLVATITTADAELGDGCTNIAFTYDGLAELGLDAPSLNALSRELSEGMTTDHRQRILGDFGSSHPDAWSWGGPKNEPVHCILLLYARTDAGLDAMCEAQRTAFENGCREVARLDTRRLPARKEHFGFRDGIAQPEIRGFWPGNEHPAAIAAGEVLLGYRNQSGRWPEGPFQFGRNGTYLVVRQLEQYVRRFWEYVDHQTRSDDGASNPDERTWLASKMVGRWPSGAPLVVHPHTDPHHGLAEEDLPDDAVSDDFLFHARDPHGHRCPIGSHIRRSNPRDALEPSPASSLRNSALHRIVRRGRAYGEPIAASMEPSDVLASTAEDAGRGLHFLCFNANIAQQFEFVQQNWINSPKFESLLYASADPITGAHYADHPHLTGTFTIQAEPVRRRVTGVPRVVDVKGGAYFFMPGVRSLARLARKR